MDEFPPNSNKAKTASDSVVVDKGITRVTSEEPTRRKKPLTKQFQSTFMGGNLKNAMQYVVLGVLIPAAKDAIVDAGSQGIEKLIFGDSRRRGNKTGSPLGYVSYNRYGSEGYRDPRTNPPAPGISHRARAQHDFDEIVLQSRTEAEEVIDRLYDLLSRFDSASVADLYELTGIKPNHVDHRWGWTDLRGSGVSRVRNGYLLNLPSPEPLA